MANSSITFTKLIFIVEDELTHCEVRWTSDDPLLYGSGAKRTYPKSVPVIDIVKDIHVGILTDERWNRLG